MTTQPEAAVGDVAGPEGNADKPSLEERFAAHAASQDEPEDEDHLDEAEAGDDYGPDDAPAEVDEADDADEAADLPPIKPPASLTAEEKEDFANWPRAAQETFARRIGEMEKGFHAKTQEAARVRTQVEAQALTEVRQLAETHVQRLQMLLPQIPERPSPTLQVQDPVEWAQQQEVYDWAVAQHQQVQQEIEHAARLAQTAQQEHANRVYAENVAILQDQFPEYLGTDPDVRKGLREVATELGFTQEELSDPSAREILALRTVQQWKNDAAEYRKLMSKRMEAVRAGKTAPRVSRPGQVRGREAAGAQRLASDREAMRRGDADAAARVFSRHL